MKNVISFRIPVKRSELSTRERKKIFYIINSILILGGVSLISGLLILVLNFDRVDNMISLALPFIMGGIVLFLLYYGLDFHYDLKKIRSDYFKAFFG